MGRAGRGRRRRRDRHWESLLERQQQRWKRQGPPSDVRGRLCAKETPDQNRVDSRGGTCKSDGGGSKSVIRLRLLLLLAVIIVVAVIVFILFAVVIVFIVFAVVIIVIAVVVGVFCPSSRIQL